MERTNTQRAERALGAIASEDYGEGFDLRHEPDAGMSHQAVKDLLGDLRHFCDRTGVDYADADSGAYSMYSEERALDPAGDWPTATTGSAPATSTRATASIAPVVVVVRYPDHANGITAYPGDGLPVVLDVDLGSSFDGVADDAEQYAEWRQSMDLSYRQSGLPSDHPAFAVYIAAIESADPAGR